MSHQHKPDLDLLIPSVNCEIVNGRFTVGSASDGDILANVVFGSDEIIHTLEIEKSDQGVLLSGFSNTELAVEREIPQRFSCRKSVLTVVLDDQGNAGNGLVTQASDKKLEIFSMEEDRLTLRFVDSALTFIFIVPAYQSEDYEVVLERVIAPNAN